MCDTSSRRRRRRRRTSSRHSTVRSTAARRPGRGDRVRHSLEPRPREQANPAGDEPPSTRSISWATRARASECRSASRTTRTLPRSPSGSSGAGRGVSNLLMLTLGTGVGGGLVLDGRLYRGWAELGHVVLRAAGRPVRGTATVTGTSSRSSPARRRIGLPSSSTRRETTRGCSSPAHARVRRRRRRSSRRSPRSSGPRSARSQNIFDPEIVVIGGGFGEAAGELLLGRHRRPHARKRSSRQIESCGSCRRSWAARPDSLAPGSSRSRRWAKPARSFVPLAVCATPIGNLEDVTLRVLRELAEADLVLCEDTRRTRILLDRHGIAARLESHHRHNEAARIASVLRSWTAASGSRSCRDAGLPASTTLEGASLRLRSMRVCLSPCCLGLRRSRPPRRERAPCRRVPVHRLPAAARRRAPGAGGGARRLCGVGRRVRVATATSGVARGARGIDADRPAAVCRELTKRFEEVAHGTVAELADRFVEPPRGGSPW